MATLTQEQYKKYLKSVFDIESALYQNQQLVENYSNKRIEETPQKPQQKNFMPPERPPEIDTKKFKATFTVSSFIVVCIFAISGFLGFFLLWFGMESKEFDAIVRIFAGIVFLLISLFSCWVMFRDRKLQINEAKKKNKLLYDRELSEYNRLVAQESKEYAIKLQEYSEKSRDYRIETQSQLKKLNALTDVLNERLKKLYNQNVIYEKYRNFVAIATIYEYFDSGRCFALEGPNGAYNMYEREIRANTIISSLAQIITDLDQIKNGQYALYKEIRRSNEEVTYLLNNIKNTQVVTAYYTQVAALAALADRVTYGIII